MRYDQRMQPGPHLLSGPNQRQRHAIRQEWAHAVLPPASPSFKAQQPAALSPASTHDASACALQQRKCTKGQAQACRTGPPSSRIQSSSVWFACRSAAVARAPDPPTSSSCPNASNSVRAGVYLGNAVSWAMQCGCLRMSYSLHASLSADQHAEHVGTAVSGDSPGCQELADCLEQRSRTEFHVYSTAAPHIPAPATLVSKEAKAAR